MNDIYLDLSCGSWELVLSRDPFLRVSRWAIDGDPWVLEGSALFSVEMDGVTVDGGDCAYSFPTVTVREPDGARHVTLDCRKPGCDLLVEYHIRSFRPLPVAEFWLRVRNQGTVPHTITRADSLVLHLAPATYELHGFTSVWGEEFEPLRTRLLAQPVVLESRSGRSSHGHHPWCRLVRDPRGQAAFSVAWSGNWAMRWLPRGDRTVLLRAGLHDWEFSMQLPPGGVLKTPPVVVVMAPGDDLDEVSVPLARVGRRFWYPHNEVADRLPVEWNHWFPYIDRDIDERTFLANVDVAASLGIEACVLDAGWFGPAAVDSAWYDHRGDWDSVNTARFPSGIRTLADHVHARGLLFGLWCEIEALGRAATLAHRRPELAALRDGRPLGYVCLGNPAAREWAWETLDRIIRDWTCDWLKLDFNLDPGAGCNRTDHGHGAGDGLYAHYRGYYDLLARVRHRHPNVILENCSSGGQRIDLGLARHTHMAFLSDPDWPEHSLQVFWGASCMLAPDACLHWAHSQHARADHPQQRFDPTDPALKPHQVDFHARMAMLHRFGLSQRLAEWPDWLLQRYRQHIAFYKGTMRRFVREADLLHLTEQPLRQGQGERWVAFQYALPETDEHLVAVFRLPGADHPWSVRLKRLQEDRPYVVSDVDTGQARSMPGCALMERGFDVAHLPPEGSGLWLVRPAP